MQATIRGRGLAEPGEVETQQSLRQEEDPSMKSSPGKLRSKARQGQNPVPWVIIAACSAAMILLIVWLNSSAVPPASIPPGAQKTSVLKEIGRSEGTTRTSVRPGRAKRAGRPRGLTRPSSVALNMEPCPKKCNGGTELDAKVCPKLNSAAVKAIHENINQLSIVWEWGSGPSALYFAPCVSKWHIVISHPTHCEDIAEIKPENMRMHCVWGKKGVTEGYINSVAVLDNTHELVDVVIADGLAKLEGILAISSKLRPSSVVFVTGWSELQSHELMEKVKNTFQVVKELSGEDEPTVAMLKIQHSDNPEDLQTRKRPRDSKPDEEKVDEDDVVVVPEAREEEDSQDPDEEEEEADRNEDADNDADADDTEKPRKKRKGSKRAKSTVRNKIRKWQKDPIVKRWKQDRRDRILGDTVPDKYGPSQGYPCSDKCLSGYHIENTVCPMMYKEEAELLAKALNPDSVVWEWGAGASSLYFSQCVKKWTSIEHVTAWCLEMRSVAPPNTEVRCIPIESAYRESFGDPGTWDGSKEEFKKYVNAIHSLGDCTDCLDVVIIDGRARKDCAVEVLPYLREDSVVFIHDWVKERFGGVEKYDESLEFYEVLDYVYVPAPPGGSHSGLVMLKPKPEALKKAKSQRRRKQKSKRKRISDDDEQEEKKQTESDDSNETQDIEGENEDDQ